MENFLKHFKSPFFILLDDIKERAPIVLGVDFDEEKVKEHNAENYGVFFTVNQFNGFSRQAKDCLGINAWAIDMDSKDISIESQERRVNACTIKPSAIVRTKNGYHCYWFAKESATVENYGTIVQRLVEYFDADANAKDVCRVLRVPGYYHCKNPEDKFLVELKWLKNVSFTEDEMLEAFPKAVEIGGISKKEFWKTAAELNNKMVLTRLSGCPEMNKEVITFTSNSDGTEQIMVNNKRTSCWIDTKGFIGSYDGGAPTFIQWLQWYGLSKAKIAEMLIDYGLVKPEKRKELFVGYTTLLDYSEKERRSVDYENSITYGTRCLDDSLKGILKDELVVIGAHTACGKSELAFKIEIHNAMKGKRVYGLHLEGRLTEITNRHIFNEIKNISDNGLTYIDFMMNTKDVTKISQHAVENLKQRVSDNLKILNKSGAITIEEFEKIVDYVKYDADLLVVDHLHYFDLGDSERTEINKIMQHMKDITEHFKIPVILISHLKRSDMAGRRMPDENELMGSSNIAKQADTVVLVFPNYEKQHAYDQGLYPTFFRHTKSRLGLPKNIVYSVDYNGIKKEYDTAYEVYKYDSKENEIIPLDYSEYPYYLPQLPKYSAPF